MIKPSYTFNQKDKSNTLTLHTSCSVDMRQLNKFFILYLFTKKTDQKIS